MGNDQWRRDGKRTTGRFTGGEGKAPLGRRGFPLIVFQRQVVLCQCLKWVGLESYKSEGWVQEEVEELGARSWREGESRAGKWRPQHCIQTQPQPPSSLQGMEPTENWEAASWLNCWFFWQRKSGRRYKNQGPAVTVHVYKYQLWLMFGFRKLK